jgi:hypothetical protein
LNRRSLLAAVAVAALVACGSALLMHASKHEPAAEDRSRAVVRTAGSDGFDAGSDAQAEGRDGPPTASDDFFANDTLFETVKSRAERGDAVAQRQLAEMYEDCLAYSLDRQRYIATIDATVELVPVTKMGPEEASRIERIKTQMRRFCDTVDGGQPIPYDAFRSWLEQSASSGDLVAGIRHLKLSGQAPDADAFKRYLARTLETGDTQALFELSDMFGGLNGSSDDERTRIEHAWAIVACRRGMNCGPDSRLMRQVCLSFYRCSYGNYEHFVMSELVPVAKRPEVERMVLAIDAALNGK